MGTPSGRRRAPVRVATVVVAGCGAAVLVAGLVAAATQDQAATASPPPITSTSPTSEPTAAAIASPGSGTAEPMLAPAQDVLVLGDSLALSTYAWLADLMPDRRVTWDAEVGRSTPAAFAALQSRLAAGSVPPVLVVSSGTNDLASSSLRRAAERILDLAGPRRCVVWADVVRPDTYGDGVVAANSALDAAFEGRANVVVVRWSRMIGEHPEWMSGDGVHPVQAGNEARAAAFADGVFSCSPFDPDAPRAPQEYLPPEAFLSPGGSSVPGVAPPPGAPSPKPTPKPAPSRTRSPSPSPEPTASVSPEPSASSEPSQSSTAQPSPSPETTTEVGGGP